MNKPRFCYGSIGALVGCKLFYHLHLCSGMRKHVDKVVDEGIEIVILISFEHFVQTLTTVSVVYFVISIFDTLSSETLKKCPYKLIFMLILTPFVIVECPIVWIQLHYLTWHKSREQCISGILGCRWQNTAIEFGIDIKVGCKHLTYCFPLIESEIINYDKHNLLSIVD